MGIHPERGRRARAARPRLAARRPALAHRHEGREGRQSGGERVRRARATPSSRSSPGSALFKKPPRFVMSAELVETSRLWARVNARDRARVDRAARRPPAEAHVQRAALGEGPGGRDGVREGHAVRRADRRPAQGQLRPDRRRRPPATCSSATRWSRATGGRTTSSSTTTANCSARSRSWSTAPGAATSSWTTRRCSTSTTSGCPTTWSRARTSTPGGSTSAREEPELLDFERSMLINEAAEAVTKDDYPDSWRQGPLKFRVTYQFEPGADADGVTVHIPLQVLNQVTDEGFDWQIPGLREEVVTELIRSLPKPIRRHYVPAPNFAQALPRPGRAPPGAAAHDPGPGAAADGRRAGHGGRLRLVAGARPSEDHLPDRRRAAPQARRGQGSGGARSSSCARRRARRSPRPPRRRRSARAASPSSARASPTGRSARSPGSSRPAGRDSRSRRTRRWSTRATRWPVRLFDTEAEQRQAMWRGTRRLILLQHPGQPGEVRVRASSPTSRSWPCPRNPHGSIQALFDDCATAAADRLIADHGGPGVGRGVVPQALREGARRPRRRDRADRRRRCSRSWRPGRRANAG